MTTISGSVADVPTSNAVSAGTHQDHVQAAAAVSVQFDQLRLSPSPANSWTIDSDFSDELGDLNIEGEDLTLQHVPIEEWGCSLTD